LRRITHIRVLMALAALMVTASCGEDPSGPGWHSISKAGFDFSWNVDGSVLHVELTGPTTGWVLVGFKGTYLYNNANILIGHVSGGAAHVRDDFGFGNDTHESDSSLQGGQQNASDVSGSESSGETTISFTIPLNSGDTWDNVMEDGETIPLVLAAGENGADDFTSGYNLITSTTISL
jgi:hypothetical protein